MIANVSPPLQEQADFGALWDRASALPPRRPRISLFEQPVDWGFHLYALGVHLLDLGRAEEVEFWDFGRERGCRYLANGILKVMFWNEQDVAAYLERTRPVDLFVNHGFQGGGLVRLFEGKTFRVHVPTLRTRESPLPPAECYLFDDEAQLTARSMVYVPVVNTERIRPGARPAEFDFLYLASAYEGKRHDLLVDAVRGTELTGHLHPVAPDQVDLRGTQITTSDLDARPVLELLQSARIAVYPGDQTSNPAAMWECVAAGLPIVMNAAIGGGKHLVVPGVTGELAEPDDFLATMRHVLEHRETYRPREHFLETWDTVRVTERYLTFFAEMGWDGWAT